MSEVELWEQFDLAHRSVARHLDRAIEGAHGLNLRAFELLRALAAATSKRLRMSDLAAQLEVTPSGVTRLVERLEADGSVTRLQVEPDRRVVHAELTARGAARMVAVAETYDATIRRLMKERFSSGGLLDLSQALRRREEAARISA